jgi:hypothetical protein
VGVSKTKWGFLREACEAGVPKRPCPRAVCPGNASVLGPNERRRRPRSEAMLSPRLDRGRGEILRICLRKTRICANHCSADQPGPRLASAHAATPAKTRETRFAVFARQCDREKIFLLGFAVTH